MRTTYSSQLATLLYLKPASLKHPAPGRLVRFDMAEPDPRFTSGPVQARVLRYMQEYRQPISVAKLAHVVDTRGERVLPSLKRLMSLGQITELQIDEDTTEYVLRDAGTYN